LAKTTDQEVLRYTEVGKVWTGLKWLRRDTSGALLVWCWCSIKCCEIIG